MDPWLQTTLRLHDQRRTLNWSGGFAFECPGPGSWQIPSCPYLASVSTPTEHTYRPLRENAKRSTRVWAWVQWSLRGLHGGESISRAHQVHRKRLGEKTEVCKLWGRGAVLGTHLVLSTKTHCQGPSSSEGCEDGQGSLPPGL